MEPKITTYSQGEPSIFSNAYLIETSEGIVAIDATLTVSGGKALNKMVKNTGKKLLAVLLTHGHPDHYNGVTELIEGKDVPIIATAAVDTVIREYDGAKEKQWKPVFGDEWPSRRTFPSKIFKDGESVVFGGVTFTVHDMGPGESHADSYWVMEYNGVMHAFIGDIVLGGVHAYLADGHSSAWLETISSLKSLSGKFAKMYPGHGEPGNEEILDRQKAYIERYRQNVKILSEGRGVLSEEAKGRLVQEMKKFLPGGRLEFLIGLSADAVAAEMVKEPQASRR
ncbi:MAG: MBL fold metallo-hydrolase [Candidatus Aenigmarchaeota archaeon]|nr:MBL fold metallo-hydrolase [Candidatus Aenigmarchaeota archaeon]